MKSPFFRKIISVFCTIVIFVGGFFYSSRLFINKTSRQKYEPFFNSDKDFDVLFFGSSHVINGVSPLDLFRDYGITSYNLSMHGNFIPSNYYLMKEIFEFLEQEGRRLPKMVVLDIYSSGDESIPNIHNAWDSFFIFSNKIEMAQKIISKEDQKDVLMPFSLYHNRWNELKKNDFYPALNELYGVEFRYGVSYPASEIISDINDKKDIDEKSIFYLNKIKDLCESYGIRLALINIPYSYRPDKQREANSIYEYAEEQNIWYENYINQDIGIDFDIDFYDQGHLNPAGMRKMTKELGRLLIELGIEDHRGEKQAEKWQEEYEQLIWYRIKRLAELEEPKIYLMSLSDPDLSCDIWIKASMMEDRQIAKQIECLKEQGNKITIEQERPEITLSDGKKKLYDMYCIVYKNEKEGIAVHSAGFICRESWEKQ